MSQTNHKDKNNFEQGILTKVDISNVHDTVPTEAQVIAAFGTAAAAGAGFVGIINDDGASINNYIVWSTGTKFVFLKGAVCA